jgi:hypothetical protein
MINFRFHLVSLIAVFLALGLGILVGSTVVDQKIVNRLDREIRSVRKENGERRAAGDALSKQNSQLQEFIDQSAPYVGDARLDGLSIAVIAERGVNAGAVKQAQASLQAAGSDTPAVLWLDDSWRLDTDARVKSLQSALGLSGGVSTTRDEALRLLLRRLSQAAPTGSSTSTSTATSLSTPASESDATSTTTRASTTTTTPAARVDTLAELEQAGFVSITDGAQSAFESFPTHLSAVLLITGDHSDFAGTDFTANFARALVNHKIPTVVGAVYDKGGDPASIPERGAALAPILDDRTLAAAVSTVDDLEIVQGRVASVLSLEIIGTPNVGHYGYGADATAPLPPHRS